jgi:DNA-nicking Smr family endonuclease
MSPLLTSSVAFVCIVGGAGMGFVLRRMVPEHHLTPDTKDVVRLGTGPGRHHGGPGAGLADRLGQFELRNAERVKELASSS